MSVMSEDADAAMGGGGAAELQASTAPVAVKIHKEPDSFEHTFNAELAATAATDAATAALAASSPFGSGGRVFAVGDKVEARRNCSFEDCDVLYYEAVVTAIHHMAGCLAWHTSRVLCCFRRRRPRRPRRRSSTTKQPHILPYPPSLSSLPTSRFANLAVKSEDCSRLMI